MTQNGQWTMADIPDQHGKVAVVTGANSGLGYETSRALAAKGAHVIMTCRTPAKGEDAAAAIRAETPDATVDVMELDLANLASVRAFAVDCMQRVHRLDQLINNAGVMALPYRKTADGFEMQFGTNHLGHFALTGLLMPRLLETPGARVVTVSSGAHQMGEMDFSNLQWERGYQKWRAYGRSKLANLLFTYELQRRLEEQGAGVISVAAHPGYAATNLQTAGPEMAGAKVERAISSLLNSVLAQDQSMGALPQLYAATAPDVQGGDYIGPGGFMEMRGYPTKVESNEKSHDQESARRLWRVSEELTGVTYPWPDDVKVTV